LCVIRPSRDYVLDRADLAAAMRILSGRDLAVPSSDYAAMTGLVGRAPYFVVDSPSPFRRSVEIGATTVEVRMESWLAFDTIRRMGFGQVVVGRRHALIVERGVSFAAFDRTGQPLRTVYRANIFAPEPRYLVKGR